MRLLDTLKERYRAGFYEGMASGAAVLVTANTDNNREGGLQTVIEEARKAYATNGVVAACVTARMMMLAEARFQFRSKVDKSLYGTEALRILEYPWPNCTAGELWARMEQSNSTAGNAFVWKADTDRLVVLPPDEVTIVSQVVRGPNGRYRDVIGYDWDPSKGQVKSNGRRDPAQFLPVDEVAHWSPYPDPLANFRGVAWLQPIMQEVYGDGGLTQYKTMYLDHGQPVQVIHYPVKLRSDTIDSLVDRIKAKYGGVGNAFNPLVLDQGSSSTVGGGLKELDYAAVQAVGEARICAAAGVPTVVVGLQSPVRASEGLADGMRRFADLTMRPLWRTGCASLQKLVPNVPERGVELWYDTTDVAALQAAETEKAQVTQVTAAAMLTLVQAGYTRDSVVSACVSGDLSLLAEAEGAPTPGVSGRETLAEHEDVSNVAGVTGNPPGGGQVLTQAQTPASKKPLPASFPNPPGKSSGPKLASVNSK